MVKINLLFPTEVLLEEIEEPKRIRKKSIARTYALAIISDQETDWEKVNKAIIKRCGEKGLEEIKEMAWNILEK